ncbi:hypothetical protein QE152_g30155 [Popillia japonica]|uniref:Uncharacterized protein n=1 Tax=Popillia japonica TaxID=7064 RepID=A0AAW1JEM5_POPJA
MKYSIVFLFCALFNSIYAYRQENLQPELGDLIFALPPPKLQGVNVYDKVAGTEEIILVESVRGARVVNAAEEDGTIVRGYEDAYKRIFLTSKPNGDFKYTHTVRF